MPSFLCDFAPLREIFLWLRLCRAKALREIFLLRFLRLFAAISDLRAAPLAVGFTRPLSPLPPRAPLPFDIHDSDAK